MIKEFCGGDAGELLGSFDRAPVLFVPLAENLVETGEEPW